MFYFQKTVVIYLLIFASLFLFSSCNDRKIPNGKANVGGNIPNLQANAGGNIVQYLLDEKGERREIVLDGSASIGAKTYLWTQTDGMPVSIIDNQSSTARFIPSGDGQYKFRLTITNGKYQNSAEKIVELMHEPDIFIPLDLHYIAVNKPRVSFEPYTTFGADEITLTNRATGEKFVMSDKGFQNIPLLEGDNIIDIKSIDKMGAVTKIKGLAVYNKDINFLSPPVFGVNETNEEEELVTSVSIAIKDNPDITINNITLIKTDEDFKPLPGAIAELRDDGNLDTGDDINEDGVYSGKVTFKQMKAGTHYYRIAIDYGKTAYSAPVELTSIIPLNVDQYLSDIEKVNNVLDKYFPDKQTMKETIKVFKEQKMTIAKDLENLPEVSNVKVDERKFSIYLTSGYATFFIIGNDPDDPIKIKGNISSSNKENQKSIAIQPEIVQQGNEENIRMILEKQETDKKKKAILKQPKIPYYSNPDFNEKNQIYNYINPLIEDNDDEIVIGSRNAIGLAPFAREFSGQDGVVIDKIS